MMGVIVFLVLLVCGGVKMIKSPYRFPYCLRDYLNLKHYYYYAKHLYQRMKHGVSDYDMYNFDSRLIEVLLYALPRFKNVNSKYVFYHLPEDSKLFYYNYDGKAQQEAMDRWDAMIDEIIENLGSPEIWKWYPEETKENGKKLERAFELLGRNLPALWM